MFTRKVELHYIAIVFILLLIPRSSLTLPISLLIPIISLILFVYIGGYSVGRNRFVLIMFWIGVSILVVMFGPTHFQNYLVGLSTHGFIFLLLLDNKICHQEEKVYYWCKWLIIMALTQSFIGYFQLFSYGFPFNLPYRDFTEDFLQGTFGSGGNRFVANIVIFAMVLISHSSKKKIQYNKYIYLLSVTLVLTSSNMSLFTMIFSLIVVNLGFVKKYFLIESGECNEVSKSRGFYITKLLLFSVLCGFFVIIGGDYVYDTYIKWTSVLHWTYNARIMGVINTFSSLPINYPLQPVLGIGLGGYSSWAQLLQSEDYLLLHVIGKHSTLDLTWFISQSEVAFDNILKFLSEGYFRAETESVINQPFFSWQSIYAEQGLFGLIVLFLLITPKIRYLKLRSTDSHLLSSVKKSLIFYTVFMIINGFVDNYYEYVWLTVPYITGLLIIPRNDVKDCSINPGSERIN